MRNPSQWRGREGCRVFAWRKNREEGSTTRRGVGTDEEGGGGRKSSANRSSHEAQLFSCFFFRFAFVVPKFATRSSGPIIRSQLKRRLCWWNLEHDTLERVLSAPRDTCHASLGGSVGGGKEWVRPTNELPGQGRGRRTFTCEWR